MHDIKNQWALVTGASSGLGVDFATLLAEQGCNLVLAARRTEPMEALAAKLSAAHGIQVVVEGIDLANAGAGTELKARLAQRQIAIDILINNAGYGVFGPFHAQPLERTLNMLQLNINSLTELTHIFAADMVQRGGGQILLVSSILGYQATPGYAAYAASKAYVLLFGEALNRELAVHNVTVSVLSPGVTATSFLEVSGQTDSLVIRLLKMRPRPVAQVGLNGLMAGSASRMPGLGNRILIFMNRFLPRGLQTRIMDFAMTV